MAWHVVFWLQKVSILTSLYHVKADYEWLVANCRLFVAIRLFSILFSIFSPKQVRYETRYERLYASIMQTLCRYAKLYVVHRGCPGECLGNARRMIGEFQL
jgi:hypothetical protein